MRIDKKPPQKFDKKTPSRVHKRGVVGYSKKSALLEEAITHMNTGKYGRSSTALKELLALDPHNTEARRLFATLHLRLGSLVTARQAVESLANEAIGRQDFWLAESLLREYLAAGPRCVPFLELLAHVYEEKGDSMAAVAELGKAIDVLIEDPDAENPKKLSQIYAKVRELAPVSAVAFQFASLFDIQTGEFIRPQPVAPAAVTSSEVDASQPQDEILSTTEESSVSDVMPWEQLDGALRSPEVPPHNSLDSVIESLDVPDVLIDPPPVGSASQELRVPPSESTGPIQEANPLDQDMLPSISDLSSSEEEQAAIPVMAEPQLPSSGHRDEGMGYPIVELSPFVDEGLTPSSSEERTADVEIAIASPVGSPGLSSPMPWEQIENATIRIEEAEPSSASLAQSEGALLFGDESLLTPSVITQPESVSDQLASPASAPDLTEPSESIFAVDPSTSPAVLPEPEVPAPPAADSSSTVPFSWNTVFDGAWKFGAGTSSSSAPSALSNPSTSLQNARELESVQPESVPEPELSSSFITSAPEPPVSFSDPELLPTAYPSIVSEVSGSIAEADAIREPDLPWPTPVLLSEEPSRLEEPPSLSRDAPSSFKVDLPVPPLSEPVEPAREAEPILFSSFMESQPVAPVLDASAPEPSRSAVIPEAPPALEPVSTMHHEIPITLFQATAASPPSVAPSDAPSESSALMDTLSSWSTGEVEVQSHRPSEKKRNWDKEKGEAPVVPPAPLPLVEEPPEVVAALSRSGGWESVPSAAEAPVVEKVVLQEDTRPEWVRVSESITFVNLPPSPSETWQNSGIESTPTKPEFAPSIAASAVDILFDSTGLKSQVPTQDRLASPRPRSRFAGRVARVRIGISSFIGSCFSTTQSIALLCVGLAFSCVALMAVGIGAVGLAWMVMEAPPSSVYHNLTTSPPLALTDSRKNGYLLLLGFEASAERDPLQAGYERKVDGSDLQAASACMVGDEGKVMTTAAGVSANVVRGWFTSADPVAQLKPQAAAIRSWVAQESVALRRYQQWISMPFEDVGYGAILSPNCAHIVLAHRLYLAEGFTQSLSTGLERLETDMGSWRAALGQSKTLMVKMLAATAVQDDVAIASGLLTRQDLEGTTIG